MPSPIVTSTVQATVLSAVSNVSAQFLTAYRSNKPFSIDTASLLQFMVFTALNTPPNYLWQQFLEDSFPSQTPDAGAAAKAGANGKAAPRTRLSYANTLAKFVIDGTLGALVNTVLFIALMGALRGQGADDISRAVRNDTWPIMLAGYKFWPAVSLASFAVVPLRHRILFMSTAGLLWGVFMSLYANRQ